MKSIANVIFSGEFWKKILINSFQSFFAPIMIIIIFFISFSSNKFPQGLGSNFGWKFSSFSCNFLATFTMVNKDQYWLQSLSMLTISWLPMNDNFAYLSPTDRWLGLTNSLTRHFNFTIYWLLISILGFNGEKWRFWNEKGGKKVHQFEKTKEKFHFQPELYKNSFWLLIIFPIKLKNGQSDDHLK